MLIDQLLKDIANGKAIPDCDFPSLNSVSLTEEIKLQLNCSTVVYGRNAAQIAVNNKLTEDHRGLTTKPPLGSYDLAISHNQLPDKELNMVFQKRKSAFYGCCYLVDSLKDYPLSDREIHLIGTIIMEQIIYHLGRHHYVNLKREYLINRYGETINASINRLEREGILEVDHHYVVGEKSKGYRLAQQYRSNWHKVQITDKQLLKRLKGEKDRPVFNYLFQQLRRIGFVNPSYSDLFDLAQATSAKNDLSVEEMMQVYKDSLTAIQDGILYFNHDNRPGRLFTNISGLKRELRPCLRVDNKSLYEFDLSCSQYCFLALYMRRQRRPDTDFEDACQNDLYANVASATGYGRDYVKHIMVEEILFGKKDSKVRQAFNNLFPKVAKFLAEQDKKKLAVELQSLESQLIISRICERIRTERNGTFIATIHDSVLCLPADKDYIRQVFGEEINRFGLLTKFKEKQL
jgi:hypothetical protein